MTAGEGVPSATAEGVVPGASDGPSSARVVIAEDEAIVRLDLKEILVTAGYEVVGECGRGDEAVELVEEHQPDLAILDIKMPGMDGLPQRRGRSLRGTVWPSCCSRRSASAT